MQKVKKASRMKIRSRDKFSGKKGSIKPITKEQQLTVVEEVPQKVEVPVLNEESTSKEQKPKRQKKPRGRPRTVIESYTDEIAETICKRISNGSSLKSICKDMGISFNTVFIWLKTPSLRHFYDQYTLAREVQSHLYEDELVDIADDSRKDFAVKKKKNGEEFLAPDWEVVKRSELRISTRRWVIERMQARRTLFPVNESTSGEIKLNIVATQENQTEIEKLKALKDKALQENELISSSIGDSISQEQMTSLDNKSTAIDMPKELPKLKEKEEVKVQQYKKECQEVQKNEVPKKGTNDLLNIF